MTCGGTSGDGAKGRAFFFLKGKQAALVGMREALVAPLERRTTVWYTFKRVLPSRMYVCV